MNLVSIDVPFPRDTPAIHYPDGGKKYLQAQKRQDLSSQTTICAHYS